MRGFIKRLIRSLTLWVFSIGLVSVGFCANAVAAEKKEFNVAWSIYVGWMPWDYMQKTGILKKWADKYGIKINLVQVNDYIESINQYTAGKFDACGMTNMDALTIPAAGGVDTTALIIGDFSNGNDGIVLKGAGKKLADVKGQKINLVELSVSHYLLGRGLESVKLSEKDITVVNTSDADIIAAYATPQVTAVVAWNPQLATIKSTPDSALVFNSAQIPGEIIDMMMVNTKTIKENPKLGKALIGAWFESIGIMAKDDATGKAAREAMAKASGTDLAGFEAQLKTTRMFYKPSEAVAFNKSPDLIKTMDYVRKFSFDHGLLGKDAKTVDVVGISFPGGKMLGDPKNIKLRYDPSFMDMAAQGKL
ncbi:MAG: ABC transporter substrate-binding protein [Gammaproteobacteria bacterium]|nr:ABC transporter substrate-binding protein [Gammaproteobacteria bacterium]